MKEHNLPDAELDVLACLYRLGEASARDIREELQNIRPMAHGSVMTLLKRLEAKSLVTRHKAPVGKTFIYTATRAPSVTYRGIIRNLLHRVFGGNSVALVTSLFDTQTPTAEELEALQAMLDDLKKIHTRKGEKQ